MAINDPIQQIMNFAAKDRSWDVDLMVQDFRFKFLESVCEPCPGTDENNDWSGHNIYYAFAAFLGVFILCSVLLRSIIKRKLKKLKTFKEVRMRQYLAKAGMSDDDMKDAGNVMQKVKIVISLFQVLSQFTTNFPQVAWPLEFKDLVGDLQIFNFDFFNTAAIGCAAQTTFYETFIIQSFFPILVCTIIFLVHKTAVLLDLDAFSNPGIVYKYCLFILFFVYPGTSNAVLRMLRCDTLDDGSQFLYADYTIQCDDPDPYPIFLGTSSIRYQDARVLAILLIFVYPIGVPLLFFGLLWRSRDDLYDQGGKKDVYGRPIEPDEQTAFKLGPLYEAYLPQYWYWEVIELFRKLILVGILVFILPDTPTQLAVGALLALIFIVSYAKFSPYQADDDDTLQLACQVAIFMSFFTALLLTVNDPYIVKQSDAFAFVLMFSNAVPICIGIGVCMNVAIIPTLKVFFAIWRRHSRAEKTALEPEDILVVHVKGARDLRKQASAVLADVTGVYAEGYWNGEFIGRTGLESVELYKPSWIDTTHLMCLFPADVAGCTLSVHVLMATESGSVHFMGQVELNDRAIAALPETDTPYQLKPRVGMSEHAVSGSITLSFHPEKIGAERAAALKKKGKLVGNLMHATGREDTMETLRGQRELLPCHALSVQVHNAHALLKMDHGKQGLCDPYCVVKFNGERVLKTPHVAHSADPSWDGQYAQIMLPKVVIDVFDHDRIGADDFLGQVLLEGKDLAVDARGTRVRRKLQRKWLGAGWMAEQSQRLVQGDLEMDISLITALSVEVCTAKGLQSTNLLKRGCEAYCKVYWNGALLGETRKVVAQGKVCTPQWASERFDVCIYGDIEQGGAVPTVGGALGGRLVQWDASELRVEVWSGAHFMGEVVLAGKDQLNSFSGEGKFYDLKKKAKVPKSKSKLHEKLGVESFSQKYVDGSGELQLKFHAVEKLQVQVVSAHDLARQMLGFQSVNPYLVVSHNGAEVARTEPQKNSRCPVWSDAVFVMPLQRLTFEMFDHDAGIVRSSEFMGQHTLFSDFNSDFLVGGNAPGAKVALPLQQKGEGEQIPVQGAVSVTVNVLHKLQVQVVDGTALRPPARHASPAFYVVALYGDAEVGRTSVVRDSLNPVFCDEWFEIHVPHPDSWPRQDRPDSSAYMDAHCRLTKTLELRVFNRKGGLAGLQGDVCHGVIILPLPELKPHKEVVKYPLQRVAGASRGQDLVGGALGLRVLMPGGEQPIEKPVAAAPGAHFSIMDVMNRVPPNPLTEIAQSATKTLGVRNGLKRVQNLFKDTMRDPKHLLPVMRQPTTKKAALDDKRLAELGVPDVGEGAGAGAGADGGGEKDKGLSGALDLLRVRNGKAQPVTAADKGKSLRKLQLAPDVAQQAEARGGGGGMITNPLSSALSVLAGAPKPPPLGVTLGGTRRGNAGAPGGGLMKLGAKLGRGDGGYKTLSEAERTNDLDAWLRAARLDQARPALTKAGIASMDDVREIEPDDLGELGLPHFLQKRMHRVLFDPASEQELRGERERRHAEAARQQALHAQEMKAAAQHANADESAANALGLDKQETFVGHSHGKRVLRRNSISEGSKPGQSL
eukprot:g3491.t1